MVAGHLAYPASKWLDNVKLLRNRLNISADRCRLNVCKKYVGGLGGAPEKDSDGLPNGMDCSGKCGGNATKTTVQVYSQGTFQQQQFCLK